MVQKGVRVKVSVEASEQVRYTGEVTTLVQVSSCSGVHGHR